MKQVTTLCLVLLIAAFTAMVISADPAPPHGLECLKSMDVWEQVQGKWAITNGVLTNEPAGFDKIAVLKESVAIPGWYDVMISVAGLSGAQEQSAAIVFGYRSKDEYWICTYEQRESEAHVRLRRILKGVPDISVDAPLARAPSDRVTLQLHVRHAEATYMTAMVDHHSVVSFNHPGELPRRCGVLVHSSNVLIDMYTLSGIAKR